MDYITHSTGDIYMSRSRSTQSMSLLVTGILAGMGGVGCTKKAGRSSTLETAASSVTTTRAADPAAPASDTSASLGAPDTPAPKPPPRKPVGHPVPMPRPARDSLRASPKPAVPDKWLSYDPATNTVTFELMAGPFTFDGYRNGEGTLVLPPKANMVINFVNKDGTPHSAIVVSADGPIPNSATDPAIPRAYTNKVLEGLPQEATDVMRFPVPESGTYRIVCGVPGHALSGMWIWLKVDPAAKTPSFGPTKA
ncbi:MAG: sulfocyanin-like copper-binding protein [Gemmatimonadales bacterium]